MTDMRPQKNRMSWLVTRQDFADTGAGISEVIESITETVRVHARTMTLLVLALFVAHYDSSALIFGVSVALSALYVALTMTTVLRGHHLLRDGRRFRHFTVLLRVLCGLLLSLIVCGGIWYANILINDALNDTSDGSLDWRWSLVLLTLCALAIILANYMEDIAMRAARKAMSREDARRIEHAHARTRQALADRRYINSLKDKAKPDVRHTDAEQKSDEAPDGEKDTK